MKATHTRTLVTTLALSVEEALWLKHQMQNGLPEEIFDDKLMRETFFNNLPDFQELEKLAQGYNLEDSE